VTSQSLTVDRWLSIRLHVFRAEQGGMSTQTVYLSHQKKKIVVLLSYDEAKNDPSALQAMEDKIASFKRFDCYEEVSSDMVSVNANIICTRWVISKKINDDGMAVESHARGSRIRGQIEGQSVFRFPSRFVCGSAPCSGVTG
jgi:hypothetical protein